MPEKKIVKNCGVTRSRRKTVFPLSHHVDGRLVALISVQARPPGGTWRRIDAYLDSGAHTSVFTAETLKELGVESLAGSRVVLSDSAGKNVLYTLSPMEVRVGKESVLQDVAVSKQYRGRFNILGIDFFAHFRITFDVANRRVLLEG